MARMASSYSRAMVTSPRMLPVFCRPQTGEDVQGWTAGTNGTIDTSGATSNIVLPRARLCRHRQPRTFRLTRIWMPRALLEQFTGTFSAPMQVVDSLGNTHDLTITFTQSAASSNTWSYDVTIPGGDLTGGTAGTQQSVLRIPRNHYF